MRDRIRQLQALDPPRVTLDKRHGATTLVIREDTAYLENPNDAEYVAACCLAAPAFLDEIEGLEARNAGLGEHVLLGLEGSLAEMQRQRDDLAKKLAETEELLRKETLLRTTVQRRARRLALAIINRTVDPTSIAADIAKDKTE